MSPAGQSNVAVSTGEEVQASGKPGKKDSKTMDVVLIGCKRWSPRLAAKVFHSRDENGDFIIHTVPLHIGKILLKKRSAHGARYFRQARPEDYEKKALSDEEVVSEDEEEAAFSPKDLEGDEE